MSKLDILAKQLDGLSVGEHASAAAAAAPAEQQPPPKKMTRAEKIAHVAREFGSVPGLEVDREFSVFSEQERTDMATIVVDTASEWEGKIMTDVDRVALDKKINTNLELYYLHQRTTDMMTKEEKIKLEAEHTLRCIKKDTRFLIDVITKEDTLTLAEKHRCADEITDRIRETSLQALDKIEREEQKKWEPRTPAEKRHHNQQLQRKQKLWKEWSKLTFEEHEGRRLCRAYLMFHILQTQSSELFAFAKDAFTNGIILTDEKNNPVVDPETGEQRRGVPGRRCFITVFVAQEHKLDLETRWNWRDWVYATSEAALHRGDIPPEDRQFHEKSLVDLESYTASYDPSSEFVLRLDFMYMECAAPPKDDAKRTDIHRPQRGSHVYKLPWNSYLRPLIVPYNLANQVGPVTTCSECRAFCLKMGLPALSSKLCQCKPCRQCERARLPFQDTSVDVFCRVACAVEHWENNHRGEVNVPPYVAQEMANRERRRQKTLASVERQAARREVEITKFAVKHISTDGDRARYLARERALIRSMLFISRQDEKRQAEIMRKAKVRSDWRSSMLNYSDYDPLQVGNVGEMEKQNVTLEPIFAAGMWGKEEHAL